MTKPERKSDESLYAYCKRIGASEIIVAVKVGSTGQKTHAGWVFEWDGIYIGNPDPMCSYHNNPKYQRIAGTDLNTVDCKNCQKALENIKRASCLRK